MPLCHFAREKKKLALLLGTRAARPVSARSSHHTARRVLWRRAVAHFAFFSQPRRQPRTHARSARPGPPHIHPPPARGYGGAAWGPDSCALARAAASMLKIAAFFRIWVSRFGIKFRSSCSIAVFVRTHSDRTRKGPSPLPTPLPPEQCWGLRSVAVQSPPPNFALGGRGVGVVS